MARNADEKREHDQQYSKKYYQEHKDRIIARTVKYGQDHADKKRAWVKKWRDNNQEANLWYNARTRAKKLGILFNIDVSDIRIPNYCPVLGLELKKGNGVVANNSPSLDRVIPELGYVKGNVEVISMRANRLKNDATLEEMRNLLKYLESRIVQ
jgi:hypothetical protein